MAAPAEAPAVVAAPSAAPSVYQFGPATGSSCSEVGTQGTTPLSLHPDGLPIDAWDGIPLLGLLVPASFGSVPGESCGDLHHGSSETGFGASVKTKFVDEANGLVGIGTTAHTAAHGLFSVKGQTAYSYGLIEQEVTVTPALAAGDASFTITTTDTVLADLSSGGDGSAFDAVSSGAGVALSWVSTPQQPECDGQPIDYDGTSSGPQVGTDTETFTFSCPSGETLAASGPIEVEFFVTQVAGLEQGTAAATVSGGIAATAGSVTMTDG